VSDKQMVIPGLELLVPTEPKKKTKPTTVRQRTANLERRVLELEIEVTLLQIRIEKGDKDNA
jgi:hypothetical protein